MKNKSKLPVMYMIVCIWMIFTAFDLMEKEDVTAVQKLSYIFLILGPLGFTILSVWLKNTHAENSAFPGTAFCLPAGLASAVIGAGLLAGPVFTVVAAIIAIFLVGLGLNNLQNIGKPTVMVHIDLPPNRAGKLERRYRYERFMKFKMLPTPVERLADVIVTDNGEASHVLFSHDFAFIKTLKSKGLLIQQDGESRKELPAAMKDHDDYWTGVLVNPIAVGVDVNSWKKLRGNPPAPMTTYKTLLSPNLTGAFAIPDPMESEAGFLFLAGLVQAMGEEKGFAIYKKLAKRAHKCLADPIEYAPLYANNDIVAVVGPLHDLLAVNSPRHPLFISIPKESGWMMTFAAIPTVSPDHELSKVFLEFIASQKGNQVLAAKARLLPAHTKALVPPGCPPQSENQELMEKFDFDGAMDDKEGLLERFKNAPEPDDADDDDWYEEEETGGDGEEAGADEDADGDADEENENDETSDNDADEKSSDQ